MVKQLKNQFFQSFFGTTLWLTALLILFFGLNRFNGTILLTVIIIAALISFVFGVCYQWLWHFSVLKSSVKILLCSSLNLSAAFLCVFLFSKEMYELIVPWAPIMVVIELVLHTLTFHIYSSYKNKKDIAGLKKAL